MRVNLTKEEFMHAYSSQYYDPVKAHEYYMKNRKLKGRSTSGMSDEQRKAWGYVKGEVMTEKKQKNEEIQKSYTAEIEGLRSEASATRERISEKLRTWLAKITDQTGSEKKTLSKTAQRQKEQIQAERQRKLDELPEIPRTASPAQKERLRASNEQKRAVINAEAKEKLADVNETISEKRSDLSEKAFDKKSGARDSATQERKIVAENLKSTISSVREKVKEIKETLNAATEDTLNKEYEKIMANIAGKAKKTKKPKKEKKNDTAAREKFIADNLARLKLKQLGGS